MRKAILALLAMLASAAPATAQELRLLMIEQTGCYICAAFNRDIAPAYSASAEGQMAPLIHADLRGPLPDGVVLATRPSVTPTFILLDAEGRETGRLIGFPGEDFFWPFIGELIARAQQAPSG